MSGVMNPRGPLPPRVYWIRRGIVLVAVIVVLALVIWGIAALIAGPGGTNTTYPHATESPTTSSKPTTFRPTTTTPTGSSTSQDDHSTATSSSRPQPSDHASGALPSALCDPTNIQMSIDVSDASVGDRVPVTFSLSPLSGADCQLSITPDVLEVQVTTGDTSVWSSTDCPDSLPARKVGVRSDPAGVYRFTWGGQQSSEGCELSSNDVGAGGYFVRAAFIGGEPHEAYFDMRD